MTELLYTEIRVAGALRRRVPGVALAALAAAAGAVPPHRPTQEAADEVKNALAPTDSLVVVSE